MNEKLSFQHIVDTLAQKSGVQKKTAEAFAKAFFDTIVEALQGGEDVVKVKGLGSFKLVTVEPRESVNVSNGERIVIPGYKKVSFTADDAVVELLNKKEDEEQAADTPAEEKAVTPAEPVAEKVVDTPVEKSVETVAETSVEKSVETVAETAVEKSVETVAETPVEIDAETPTEQPSKVVLPLLSQPSATPEKAADKPSLIEVEEHVEEQPSQSVEEKKDEIEELIQVPAPQKVELPQDDFGGIDLLISTPESVDEVRQQYEEAKAKVDAAVEEARKANAEKARLEKLLDRLEANVEPESMKTEEPETVSLAEQQTEQQIDSTTEEISSVKPSSAATVDSKDEPTAEEKRQKAFDRVMAPPSTSTSEDKEEEEEEEKKETRKRIWIVVVVLLLLGGIIFFLAKTFSNIEKVEKVPAVEKPARPVKPAAPKVNEDSLKLAAHKADSIKAAAEAVKQDSIKAAKEAADAAAKAAEEAAKEAAKKPKTHVLLKGESLTRISQKYYGTKDSVRAIIRVNTFNDPNNVPAGAVVKLP